MPTTPPYVPPPARRRRRRWPLVLGGIGVALAVVAGLLVWLSAGPPKQTGNSSPFYLAVDDLATEPVVHYSGSAQEGGGTWELKVTSSGETFGTITDGGEQIGVMTVGGKTYLKPPTDMLTTLAGGASAAAVQGKWLTGTDSLTGVIPQGLATPPGLASELWTALDATSNFPPGDAQQVKVGSDSALAVTTPDGTLYVTASAPYRVLRLRPPGWTGTTFGAASAPRPGPVVEAAWSTPVADSQADDPGKGGGTDFAPMSPSDIDQTFGDLIDQTRSLSSAIDLGVSFDFNQTGNVACSDSSCTVTENVVTSTKSAEAAKLSGTVTADMSATVTVNGQSGGGCQASASLPVNGSGTISCDDGGVAPAVQQIKAQKQAEADAQAQASGQDVQLPYTLDFEASVEISALANVQAEVDQQVSAEQAEQSSADQAAKQAADCYGNSFVAGTPVLMADGGSEPIQDVRAGDQIDNAAAGARALAAHIVTAVHVTDTDRDFVRLDVAGPGGDSGELTSTAHHLYYDATTGAWTSAADLKPGDRLQTTGAGPATVRAVHAYSAAVRTYNLTVDGVHTYYVLADRTPVLVHNAGGAWCNTRKPVIGPRPDHNQTSLYAIMSKDGLKVEKWGISGDPIGRYSMKDYNSFGKGSYLQIMRNYDNRNDALANERYLTKQWPGPANEEDHAGTVTPTQNLNDVLNQIRGGRIFD